MPRYHARGDAAWPRSAAVASFEEDRSVKAVVYHGPEDFRVERVPDPKLLAETDALIRIERTAICGSDLHLWHGPPRPTPGFTIGHEFLGTIEDAGSAVARFRRGDRVLVCCVAACGFCGLCTRGMYSGCVNTTGASGLLSNVFGNGVLGGGQAEAARVPFADATLVRIPPGLDDEQALFLTDILPTGYLGAELAAIEPGDVVVVLGCGPVGSFAQRSAQLFGPAAIVAVDLDPGRLARAAARGCHTVNPSREDLGERVRELTDGRGADAVIEAVGKQALLEQAIAIARPGARIAAIGVITEPEISLPFLGGLFAKNLTLRTGLVNPQRTIPKLLPLIQQGRIDPREIITHRLPLDDAITGYRIFAEHCEDALKVVLRP
jgi:2-desacetyl-2-hydroxyethyl bacteriochlorophyllide A dehydrogenase